MSLSRQGGCLCGAIQFTATLDNHDVSACHCSLCRTWGGGPMLAVHCSQAPRFEGAPPSVYRSSEWAERGFCGHCGTHLFYRLTGKDDHYFPVGVLRGDADWQFTLQIFVEQRPAWYCFANQTREMTGEQVQAL
ncbi:GFA family protein [Pseudomonas sp. S75]|uniref:GFA family protein n=1 Tax=unclassified Pseudomonas TaxID=196821 RepID=UPI00190714A2|nr:MULTISPECIES: GFA family protein [unclassified Pseudomonas]MBJ9975385.1 GFA family protein [Pseudomonas sp. S30]MBK0152641.1 GFA family protein [Pseudomonas sp. S75]